MSFKINRDNYEIYKEVLGIVWRHLYKNLDPKLQSAMFGQSPIETMNKWEIDTPKSKLYSGLKQALGDSILMMQASTKLTEDINVDLIASNLPNVQTLKRLISDTANKAIKRQKIRNIEEYYIIKELIDDTVANISDNERTSLIKLLGDFEQKTTSANNGFKL